MRKRRMGLEATVGFVFDDRRYAGGYQKKESLAIGVVQQVRRTAPESLEDVSQELFLGPRCPKNHSILGVCEDFEGERNDKRALLDSFFCNKDNCNR